MAEATGEGEKRKGWRPFLAVSALFNGASETMAKAILPAPTKKRSESKFMQARSQIWQHAVDEEGSA